MTAPTKEANILTSSDVADSICKNVAELPDRNSPEDWPEAMLVTQSELREIVLDAIAEWVDFSTPSSDDTPYNLGWASGWDACMRAYPPAQGD
ncbi:hypothetical protein ACSFA8_20855 [Variovorax sp. RT4R15]|uniref:hypothetical protein n=1 Tax=Variovorax sp. RT4R15 TaxID=3443737 RepID=UPI003F44C0B3